MLQEAYNRDLAAKQERLDAAMADLLSERQKVEDIQRASTQRIDVSMPS